MLASIPSPSSGVIHLGPLALHAYGIFIALGVLAAIALSNKRWVARGGTTDDINALALWGVIAGVIGARIYHVITDNELYRSEPIRALYVWDGGLGIWGGIAAGVAAGLIIGRRRGLSAYALLDMVAPALILAQAIGRWGNYFNQELFGGPTTLPWGVEIDLANRPAQYVQFATFHPTFLYESLWDLCLLGLLLFVEFRFRPRPPSIFLIYVAGYSFGRFFIEGLRIDYAHTFLGLRLNEWTSLIIFAAAVICLIRLNYQVKRSDS